MQHNKKLKKKSGRQQYPGNLSGWLKLTPWEKQHPGDLFGRLKLTLGRYALAPQQNPVNCK